MASGKTVCVTGASGFIASWVVKLLLERGYIVRGTVRNPEKSKHLLELPGAGERLKLVEAQLIDPAVKGTLNVLESCAKAKPRRIVLTSSVAAVSYTPKKEGASVVDESFFSDPDLCRKEQRWYVLSKTLAELAAWDYVKEHNLDMVTINPTMVIGPVLQSAMNTSTETVLEYLNGTTKTFANFCLGWVGVKDVAMAHILAYEKPEAEGRYICNERILHNGDVVALMKNLFPQYPIVAKDADDSPRVTPYNLSSEKVKKLGLNFQPLDDVLRETVVTLKDLKHLE
ncbi:hypothetical protein KC19_7G189600 [Ceratodon purpureus]|uniref:NAD-dependent epimerase/dehydratase domain-containing protein n=1 Tax=Ceratodon purpureus TaxID=3225 RepID=A0A8T0H9P7_CERPU|nr:hypothetical protein KC19_7G189600 [Ceratodon purpureus]